MVSDKIRIVDQRQFDVFSLKLRSDGILHIHLSNQKEYSLRTIKELNEVVGEMVNEQPVPVLMSADDFVVFPDGTRETLAKRSAYPYFKATAYLTKTTAHQLIISFYINVNKPERPSRMFENEEEALEWLKSFL